MRKSKKILAGIMSVCLMGGVAVIPNCTDSTVFAEYESKGDISKAPLDD